MNDQRVRSPAWGGPVVDPRPVRIELLSAVSDPKRLVVLSSLDESGEVAIDELAARIHARRGSVGDGDAFGTDRSGTLAALHHVHLPKLADQDLVEMVEEDETVAVRPGDGFDADAVEALVRDLETGDIDDQTVSAIGEPRRRRVVSALASAGGVVELAELAEAVAARRPRPPRPEMDDPTPDAAAVLHHVDLPKLESAGLVDYDRKERLVTYLGLPRSLQSTPAPA